MPFACPSVCPPVRPNVTLSFPLHYSTTEAMTASQTQLKVIGFSLEFYVRSISLEHFERFALNFGQMFISGRSCAEPMAQLQKLNIKATNEGRVIKP